MNDIAVRVAGFITDNLLLGKPADLGALPSLLEAGVIDSTGVLELVQFLEEEWGITVSDDEILPDNLDSVARIATFIQRKTQPAVAAAE